AARSRPTWRGRTASARRRTRTPLAGAPGSARRGARGPSSRARGTSAPARAAGGSRRRSRAGSSSAPLPGTPLGDHGPDELDDRLRWRVLAQDLVDAHALELLDVL